MNKFWEWMKENHDAYYGTNTNNKWMLWVDKEDHIINAIPTKQMLIGYMIEYIIKDMQEDEIFNMQIPNSIDEYYNKLERFIKEIEKLEE